MGKKRRHCSRGDPTTPSDEVGTKRLLRSNEQEPDGGVQKSPKQFKCPVCWKEYVLEGALRTHLLNKHPQLSTSQQTAGETSTSLGNDTDELDSEPILESIEYEVKDEPEVEVEPGDGLLQKEWDQDGVLTEPKIEVEEVKVFRIPGESASPLDDNADTDETVTIASFPPTVACCKMNVAAAVTKKADSDSGKRISPRTRAAKLTELEKKDDAVSPSGRRFHKDADSDQYGGFMRKNQFPDFIEVCYAVKEQKPCRVLSSLIQRGADWKALDHKKQSMLHVAATSGTVLSPKFFLDLGGLDINGVDEDGATALHCAVFGLRGKIILEKCKLLMQAGADVYAGNLEEDTFLHDYVCKAATPPPSEFHSMAAYLVDYGHFKIFNLANTAGNTPLHLAVHYFQPEERTLRLLHSNGVNFNALDEDGHNLLAIAVSGEGDRSLQFLEALATQFGVDPTKVDFEGHSLLHWLSLRYSWESLKSFLELRLEGMDVNAKDRFGNSPLHVLLLKSKFQVFEKCELLIVHGADVNSLNKQQKTPLHLAASAKNSDVALKTLKFLIVEHGADISLKDGENYTFLHKYLLKWNVVPFRLHSLVEFLIPVDRLCFSVFDTPGGTLGKTPLHLIVNGELEPEVETMLLLNQSKNLNFNAADQEGSSVLQDAIAGGRSPYFLASLIDECGADPKHINNNGDTGLHHAAWFGTADVLELLLEYDESAVNTIDKFGDTPLHLAIHPKSDKIDVVEKCRLLMSKGQGGGC